jgi:Nuclease-related domain
MIDLAYRPAGAMARLEATRLRSEAPVRSVLARVMGVHTDERAWRLGAIGEELVGAQLARLVAKDPRWRVLHSIPVGPDGTDIDHLVVGPGGVFTLNSKHHPRARIWVAGDTFMVNGQRHPYVHASRHEAGRTARVLSGACGFAVDVTPVVVPVNAHDITVKSSPGDVHVVNRRRLRRWLRRRPQVLDDRVIAAVHSAARWGSTWR